MLVNKEAGLVVHEDDNNTIDTLINRCLYYLHSTNQFNQAQENYFTPALCNRIDRNTWGIVIIAKNALALRFINEKIKLHQVKKSYLCVVTGIINNKKSKLVHYMIKDEKNNKVFVYDNKVKNSKIMKLDYEVIKQTKENSLVRVNLITGRTHQIRTQFKQIGHPLIGDTKYGNPQVNKKYNLSSQLLCSYKLFFDFEENTENEYKQMSYLNKKEFEIKDVWFKQKFNEMF